MIQCHCRQVVSSTQQLPNRRSEGQLPTNHRQLRPIVNCSTASFLLSPNKSQVGTPHAIPVVWRRNFQNEGHYHRIADESLETIQDTIEEILEGAGIEAEISYASGVLTMSLPPHGTYVINKQTPNQQIWWSSPFSGPRRYEYDEESERWVFTRDNAESLGSILNDEFQNMFGLDLDLNV